ncbi:DUF3618 domain-containing protein [Kribbella turkmenica]|uniref:DUF3618 domain-containing protein n=1 Tax=Kribbella turkmenica TaxID=2530375 RepID=A0A4R4WM17_9ACTN|nr:DUF3618 domain-containing protein [Kribbella turkmenica]TDD17533.1 DUF3618 domain-containing protein [Kribbella turkmenica]
MSTKANHREPISETEALRIDLEQTRAHLAGTVQELSRQLNFPGRIKESAAQAGRRLRGRVRQMPAAGRRHPKAMAVLGGAMALGLGAATWLARRHK